MNKRTIGKIQLVLGIIILLIGIGFLIFSYNSFSHLADNMMKISNENVNITILQSSVLNLWVGVFSSSIISLLISLFFITEGLVNIRDNK